MTAKKQAKILKEIEESTLLVDYLLAEGVDFDGLCACARPDCPDCMYFDHNFFSERKVREAREWSNGNHG